MRNQMSRWLILVTALALTLNLTPCWGQTLLDLSIKNPLSQDRHATPVTWGVPLSLSKNVLDTNQLQLLLGDTELPVQFTVMARWGGAPSDTSKPIAWLLIDAQVDLKSGETAWLKLVNGSRIDPTSPLQVTEDTASQFVIQTGTATFQLSKTSFRLFEQVQLNSGPTFTGTHGIYLNESPFSGPVSWTIEHSGINRISVRAHGVISGDLEFTARLQFFRNLSEVLLDFRLENLAFPELSVDGQPLCNHYGCSHSVSFDDLTLVFPTLAGGSYVIPTGENGHSGIQTGTFSSHIHLIQESSGDENWNTYQSQPPRLQSGVVKRASTQNLDGTPSDGPNQIGGWIDANQVTVALLDVWQNFPKALRAEPGQVEAGLFPSEFSRNHELRPGEMKTHRLWVRFHEAGATDIAQRAASFLSPLRWEAPVTDVIESQALSLFAPRLDDAFPNYELGTDYQLILSPEWIDEYPAHHILHAISLSQHYGWVDFGDIPTDFEMMTSPYNMKYDVLRGLFVQAIRNQEQPLEETWWDLAGAAARHVADIDILHSRTRGLIAPRSWFEGGLYGHGFHDEPGITNPHRNEMNPAVSMSGPAGALFLWSFLSGDTLVLDSAMEVSENMFWRTVNNDYFAFLGCGPSSGVQHCTDTCEGYSDPDYGRTFANVIRAMMYAYLATGEPDYWALIPDAVHFFNCWENAGGGWGCDRFNIQTTLYRNIGHYLAWRESMGLPADTTAQEYLNAKVSEVIADLWDPIESEFLQCYGNPTLFEVHDNWLFGTADLFALTSHFTGQPTLLSEYGTWAFQDGALNQFYEGSRLSYHSSKEFVNQVGMGQGFLWAWMQSNAALLNHNCSITNGLGGSAAPSGTVSVQHGSSLGIQLVPDPGYRVDQVQVDGAPISFKGDAIIRNILQDRTIHVTFTSDTCFDLALYQSLLANWPSESVLTMIDLLNCDP